MSRTSSALRPSILIILLSVAVVGAMTPISVASGQASQNQNGYNLSQVQSIQAIMARLESTVDQASAISFSSTLTTRDYSSFNLVFSSVFETFTFNHALSVNVTSINVVYDFAYPNGTAASLVVKENPSLTTIISAEIQPDLSSGTNYIANWAGYTLAGGSSSPYPAVYYVNATWTVPGVKEASNNECLSSYCTVDVWPGISDALAGGDIAQAGTMSVLDCIVNCGSGSSSGSSYFAWYEYYTGSSGV